MIDTVRQLPCPAGASEGEGAGSTTVVCHAERAGLPRTPGRVRDVSRTGLSVHLDRPLEPGTMLTIELPAVDGLPAVVLACASTFRPDPGGGWVIGCLFAAELEDGDLAGFGVPKAAAPPGDQRRWARFAPTAGRAVVRSFGVGPGSPASARILNLSPGGIGLAFATRVEPGTLLDLELIGGPGHPGLTILASVVYLAPREAGDWLLGCTFIRELPEAEIGALSPKGPGD